MSLAQYLDPAVIQQVSRLDLRARFIVEGFLAGLHASPFQGLSVEFSEHRKYTQGDDLRQIDWNVFARTDRLFIRKYAAETHLACHLLVDASASMGVVGYVGDPHTTAAKLDYAIHVAAALGYLVTQQQDSIGLGVIGDGLVSLLPAKSRRQHLLALLSQLTTIRPDGRTGLGPGVREMLARTPHRGLIVLISDLLLDPEDALRAIHQIRFRGHDLIVMHLLDAAEAHFTFDGNLKLEDPESGATFAADAPAVRARYLAALADWRADLRRRIEAVRADYVALDTSMPFDKALIEFLIQRSRRR